MTVLTIPQAAQAAQPAGFSGENLITLVAIGIAESNLNTDAHSTSGEDSRGWLQINVVSNANPQYASWDLYDPAVCAKAAWEISNNGTNYNPWTTYTGGAYLQYVAQVRAALGTPTGGGGGGSGGGTMSPPKPTWTFIGTNGQNIWAGRRLSPVAVVCHIAEGTLAGCDSWFSNPSAQASANFCVGKDGTIHCYVDPDGPDAPWANGNVANPDATVQGIIQQLGANVNMNWVTVSIEHEGNSGDALTGPQLAASASIAAYICGTHGLPADRQHIIGHYEIDSVTRAGCPGWNATTWATYVSTVAGLLKPAPSPTPDPIDIRLAAIEAEVQRLNHAITWRMQNIMPFLDPANVPPENS